MEREGEKSEGIDNSFEKSDDMLKYEEETGKYAVWRGIITEGYKKWAKGEKVYNRDKERISLYVSEETKNQWQEFIKNSNYSTISKLIGESVRIFIEENPLNESGINQLNSQTISNISHALNEPLTSIKGYSQLLLENYKEELNENILATVRTSLTRAFSLKTR